MKDLVKMYRIMDGERVSVLMPVGSVNRALQKGFILEESAQKLEMPAEIIKIMKANKAELVEVEAPEKEVEQINILEVEQAEHVSVEPEPQPEQKKPTGRPKRK